MTGSPARGDQTRSGASSTSWSTLSSDATMRIDPCRAATSGRSLMRSLSATMPPSNPRTMAKGPFSMAGP